MTIANKIEITAAFWAFWSGMAVLVLHPVTLTEKQQPMSNSRAFCITFLVTCVMILFGCAMWELWSAPAKKEPQTLEAR